MKPLIPVLVRIKFSIFVCLSILIANTSVSFAQTDTTDLFSLSLAELMNIKVVTPAQKTQKINDAPSIVSVITKIEIHNLGVSTLIGVLNFIPGIETSIDLLGNYRVSIRGERKAGNILLLINGHPLIDFYDGTTIYDIPVEFIDRIEVIRGPGSALFGTNAVAGVINVITTKKSRNISISAGTHEKINTFLNYNISKNQFNMSCNAGYSQSKGANVFPYTPPKDSLNKSKTNRWSKKYYLNTNIDIHHLKISFFELSNNHGPWIGPEYVLAPDSKLKQTHLRGDISYTIEVNPKITITPKVYFDYIQHDYFMQERADNYNYLGNIFTDGPITKENYTGLVKGANIQSKISFSEQLNLITGLLYEKLSMIDYHLSRNYYLIGNSYLGSFTTKISDSIETELNQIGKQREIKASYFQFDYSTKKIGITAGIRYDLYSDFGQSINPRLGLIYKPFKKFNLKFLYGKAFSAPTFKELYDLTTAHDKNGEIGNPDLLAESVHSAELGMEFSFKNIITRFNTFLISNKNIIGIYDPEGGGKVGKYENIGNTLSLGGEYEIYYFMKQKLNIFANISYFRKTFSWNKNNTNIQQGDISYIENRGDKVLRNIPMLRLNAGLNLNPFRQLKTSLAVSFGSKSAANNRNEVEGTRYVSISPYILVNMNISYVKQKLLLKLSANNLGPIKHSDPNESTGINLIGNHGMGQPTNTILFSFAYKFYR